MSDPRKKAFDDVRRAEIATAMIPAELTIDALQKITAALSATVTAVRSVTEWTDAIEI